MAGIVRSSYGERTPELSVSVQAIFPGTHELGFDSPAETISVHTYGAKPGGFAGGAVHRCRTAGRKNRILRIFGTALSGAAVKILSPVPSCNPAADPELIICKRSDGEIDERVKVERMWHGNHYPISGR
jgi:hypothetical protein